VSRESLTHEERHRYEDMRAAYRTQRAEVEGLRAEVERLLGILDAEKRAHEQTVLNAQRSIDAHRAEIEQRREGTRSALRERDEASAEVERLTRESSRVWDPIVQAAGIRRDGLAGLLAWIEAAKAERLLAKDALAKLADLKARIREARHLGMKLNDAEALDSDEVEAFERVTDLRVRNWRKP
jgi:predicted protein tyrosine phosphatase